MEAHYTHERNAEILIALMKEHGVKRVVARTGTTNISLVASLQNDKFFEMYSCVDERSAAYMACGIAEETGEPVALSCTGATASRNYAPGLTEAFYRHLPVLAITSSQPNSRMYHAIPQVTDRTAPMPDMVKKSYQLSKVEDAEDEWDCVVKTNEALLELTRDGGGPVHINLTATYDPDFSVAHLPEPRVMHRYYRGDNLPPLNAANVAVFVGAHLKWSDRLTTAVDAFCERYNGAVLCDTTSNYRGKYGVFGNIVANQEQGKPTCVSPDLMIHIGEVSGSYMAVTPREVWRVNPDGEIRDTFKKLTNVFEMNETAFFEAYAQKDQQTPSADTLGYYGSWKDAYTANVAAVDDSIPFSGVWMAWKTMPLLPTGSALHLGILNSLRCWNYFEMPKDVLGYCNTGGFGIDGCVSSMIGASIANPDKIFIGAFGDLTFFYDLNSLGNRYLGPNVRILLNNNGKGFEFKHYNSYPSTSGIGYMTDSYIAAAGHFGNKSRTLVRSYAEALGFEYMSAANKGEYLACLPALVDPEIRERPLLIEAFTDTDDENTAQHSVNNIVVTPKGQAKQVVKGIIGQSGVRALKNILGR